MSDKLKKAFEHTDNLPDSWFGKETLDEDEEKVWITNCTSCGSKTPTTWKAACEDGCEVCGSHNTAIYHKKNKEK